MRIADLTRTAFALAPLAILLALPACGGQPANSSNSREILALMIAAEKTVSYEGMKVFTVRSGERLTKSFPLVTHEAGGNTWIDYADQPAGRRRRWVMRRSRLGWLNDLDLLLENYEVRRLGSEEVVGRAGVVSEIRHPTENRPRVRLVTDVETGLLLDIRMWSYRGEETLASRFTTLLLDPVIPPGKERGERPTHAERDLDFTPFAPRFLPEGFEKLRSYRTRRGGLGDYYGDGLAWIRIEQTRAKAGLAERVVKKRLCGSYVRMSMVHLGVSIRLSGSLEPDTLLEVLESLGEVKEEPISVGGGRNGIDLPASEGSI